MSTLNVLFRRELKHYFNTPIAYIIIIVFVMMAGALTFYLGHFYERNQADLEVFFQFHPWLYLFIMPAIAMRLWSEERKSGSIELLLSLPITTFDAVLAKFFAAWVFSGIALALTCPIWITVNYLGEADNGVILTSYIGSWLMAGAYLAIGSFASSLTKNQIIAFILALSICFLFMLSGFPIVLNAVSHWLPQWFADAVSSLSFMNHFKQISEGSLSFNNLFFFMSLTTFWLYGTNLMIQLNKAE